MRNLRLSAVAFSLGLAAFAAGPVPAQQVVPLWPQAIPGATGPSRPEAVRLYQGEHIVTHVVTPSLTLYLPAPAGADGAAVVVIPGGGHRELWLDHEGYRVGEWLQAHGVAALVLKYRLAREDGSTWTIEGDELADVQRAIRLVRGRAAGWRVAPDRIGVLGFSAGGELAALAGTRWDAGRAGDPDPVTRLSSRPAFMALMYPAIPADMRLTPDTPPAFLVVGEKDRLSEGVLRLYGDLERAGVPAELHILTGVGHGFGMRAANPPAVAAWPTMLYDWLVARQVVGGGPRPTRP